MWRWGLWPGEYDPLPVTSDMLRTEWGDKIVPLPYDVSPFRMIALSKSALRSAVDFPDHGIKILSAKLQLLLAVPLVKPVYIANFARTYRAQTATLVLPAWRLWHARSLKYRVSYVYGPRNQNDSPSVASYGSEHTDTMAFKVGNVGRR